MERASVILPSPYALGETLGSGQAFRWRKRGRSYYGFIENAPVRLVQQRETVGVRWAGEGDAAAALSRYLRVDDPMEQIYAGWRGDERLAGAAHRWAGLHLLAQDPWETTVSFIASSASNIPKISRSIEKMCGAFGEPVEFAGETFHAFPSARALAGASGAKLRACELGYRARYVKEAARSVHEGEVDLDAVARMETAAAQAAMVEGLDGVGPKVAACALLFSMRKDDAFPVDRWVQRCVGDWYFNGRAPAAKKCEAWGRERFGARAGYAQQYLFHDARAGARGRAALRSRR